MGFFRQEYWSGLPFPSPGDLPDPGIEPGSPTLCADALPSEPPLTHLKKIARSLCLLKIFKQFRNPSVYHLDDIAPGRPHLLVPRWSGRTSGWLTAVILSSFPHPLSLSTFLLGWSPCFLDSASHSFLIYFPPL